jgi:hypothetical protein
MEEKLLELLSARRGHFVLESGHHGNLWLDLDSLFLRPARLRPFARNLRRAGGAGRAAGRRRRVADSRRDGSIARLANELWEPAACPLCAAGLPLSSPSA